MHVLTLLIYIRKILQSWSDVIGTVSLFQHDGTGERRRMRLAEIAKGLTNRDEIELTVDKLASGVGLNQCAKQLPRGGFYYHADKI